MNMVASSRLKPASRSEAKSRPFSVTGKRLLDEMPKDVVLQTGVKSISLLIPIGSDRGLCGSVNSNVNKSVWKRVSALQNAGGAVTVFAVGEKILSNVKRVNVQILAGSAQNVAKKFFNFVEVEAATDVLSQIEATDITFLYNQLVGAEPKITEHRILSIKHLTEHYMQNFDVFELEDDQETGDFFLDLYQHHLSTVLWGAINAAKVAELQSRVMAMENATNNAQDMVDALTGKYNRARQAAITSELADIVVGGAAVKEMLEKGK